MRLLPLLVALLWAPSLYAQSVPNGGAITPGQIWTAPQWTNAWQSKVDATNGTSLNQTLETPILNTPALNSPTLNGATYVGPQTFSDINITGGSVDGGTSTSTNSTTARNLATRFPQCDPAGVNCAIVNVKDFGAQGTLSFDSSAAFTAAVAKATQIGSEFWGSSYVWIYVPAGMYFISGIDIPPFVGIRGDGEGQTWIVLKAGSNRSLIRGTYLPQNYSPGTAQFTWSHIENMTLDGNSSNQTGTSHCVEWQDDPFSANRVSPAGMMRHVNIFGCHNDGVYGGTARDNGYMEHVQVNNVLGNGFQVNGFDWFFDTSSSGSAGLDGLLVNTRGCTNVVNSAFFSSTSNGVHLASGSGCYFWMTSGSLDRNRLSGFKNDSASATSTITAVHFSDNSVATNGGVPHILMASNPRLTLVGNTFDNDASHPNTPNYLVQQTGSLGQIYWYGNSWVTSPASFTVAAFSNPAQIAGAITSGGSGQVDVGSGCHAIGPNAFQIESSCNASSQGAVGSFSVAGGYNSVAGNTAAIALGEGTSAGGYSSVATGSGTAVTTNASYGTALGHKSVVLGYGCLGHAGTQFSVAGDGQVNLSCPLYGNLPSAGSVRLAADNSGNAGTGCSLSVPMSNNMSFVVNGTITYRDQASTATAVYSVTNAIVARGSSAASTSVANGTFTLASSVGTVTGVSTPTLTADTTNGCPNFSATSTSGAWHAYGDFRIAQIQ